MLTTQTNWKAVRRYARTAYNKLREEDTSHPSFAASKALEDAAKKFDVGYGIEGSADYGLTYINMGDTYATTVYFDSDEETFYVGSWGDFVENKDMEDEDDG